MPFFGSKKNEKKGNHSGDAPSYPKQQAPPPPQVGHLPPMPNSYPQGAFVQQPDQFYYNPTGQLQAAPSGPPVTMAFARSDLPGAYDNWGEGFLDGPDFSNRVPDRSIPPAPGSYYFYSQHGNMPGPAPPPIMTSSGSAPPPVPSGTCPPPPTYDEVLSQEVKKKL